MSRPAVPIPEPRHPASRWLAGALAILASLPAAVRAEEPPALPTHQIVDLARAAVPRMPQATPTRVEVVPGQLDPRLKLAPCQQIEPYLPTGTTLWGSGRVGLRCVRGSVAWNVYLPITVKVWRQAVVTTSALPAGTEIGPNDLALAEVDIAASPSPVFTDPAPLAGRRLASAVAPGTALRQQHLAQRQWFSAGETVTLAVQGEGFTASTEGQALNPGVDGQPVRVRVGSGRIITGVPTGTRRVEVRS